MINLLRRIKLDWLSFWIGFVTSVLFVWISKKFLPHIRQGLQNVKEQTLSARQEIVSKTELTYRKELYLFAQKLHLASPLFSLEEILIEPRFLPPKPVPFPGEEPPPEDIVSQIIPYTPDWPELASTYNAQSLSLSEALKGGADLLLLGPAGFGKTVALANLTSQVLLKNTETGGLAKLLPIYIHAAELNLPIDDQEPLDILIKALETRPWNKQIPKLGNFIKKAFRNNNILLMVDGADECPPKLINGLYDFLKQLKTDSQINRLVVSASPDYFGELPLLGLKPLTVLPWNIRQKASFAKKWEEHWNTSIETLNPQGVSQLDYLILNSWILQKSTFLTPLEFVLKVWSAYANDISGLSGKNFLESYIQRITNDLPGSREVLKTLAKNNILSLQPFLNQETLGNEKVQYKENGHKRNTYISRLLPNLIQREILIKMGDKKIIFAHAILEGYLAAEALGEQNEYKAILEQPNWLYKKSALHYLASQGIELDKTYQEATPGEEILHKPLLQKAEWLHDIDTQNPLNTRIIKELVKTLNNDNIPLSIRIKLLIALAKSDSPGIPELFQRLLLTQNPDLNFLAILGLGYIRDIKSVSDIIHSLNHEQIVQKAACLALVNIGTKDALEALAQVLLQSNEALQKAAAESFANHPEEGYPVLKEGVQVKDLLVRRAAIFGLKRLQQPWVTELLEEIQAQEEEWVVRDAAEQALKELTNPNPFIPKKSIPIEKTTWLSTFAKEHTNEIKANASSRDVLIAALRFGSDDEKLSALNTLTEMGDEGIFPTAFHFLFGDNPDLREAAIYAIWYLQGMGRIIPSPIQFGFR